MAQSTFTLKGHPVREVSPGIWRIEPTGKMHAGVHLVGTPALLRAVEDDRSIEQAINVTKLPGVVDPVLTMPDIHQGYGFPIGGVAAFRLKTGVVSPGGVGYDINCGVRLLKTPLMREEIGNRETMRKLVARLFETIPAGVGSQRDDLRYSQSDFDDLLTEGARWSVKRGLGTEDDLSVIEEGGCIRGADPAKVSARAKDRGFSQLGTLGSGNHFVEVQYVDEIHDEKAAQTFGLAMGQVVVTIHTGSRGIGYQVCSDYLETSLSAAKKYGLELPDRELAATPIESPEGQSYLKAMAAAANFAFNNRQVIAHWVRQVFSEQFGKGDLPLLYDVCHNIAKIEEMPVGNVTMPLCVHRKGATRAYPPQHPGVPAVYRKVGQPVIIPGDMGRYSFVLAGNRESMETTFGSACHGAGRELSRAQAKKRGQGRAIARELEEQGVYVKCAGKNTVLEEMPEAYKNAADVVGATAHAGIARVVARLRPMAVVKG